MLLLFDSAFVYQMIDNLRNQVVDSSCRQIQKTCVIVRERLLKKFHVALLNQLNKNKTSGASGSPYHCSR